MEIWEWTSHYSTCKLNFENLYGDLGMDLSTVNLQAEFRNLQAEFRKFLFGYLEVVVAPAN